MSGLINITGTTVNDDPTYRYKMPRLVAKVEGRGNGIKTVVVNMGEIAESLNRPAALPTKFFGCELGAQTRWEQDVSGAAGGGGRTGRAGGGGGGGKRVLGRRG
jgi:translation initiation factor 5